MLLSLQYDIECLEQELDSLDELDSKNGNQKMLQCKERDDIKSRKAATNATGSVRTRLDIFADLKQKLLEYGEWQRDVFAVYFGPRLTLS